MQNNIVLKTKVTLVMWNCIVSMVTYYAILKNVGVPTNILISQQQLILEYLTWNQINT